MNTIKKHLESIRHYSFPRTRALKQELDTVRKAQAAVTVELATVREDQQQQIKQVKSDCSRAQYQIEVLERSLAHAEQRQKFTETHINSLESKLEEERNRHESSMLATETRQAHMQAEQQSQLMQQTELADTFHRVSARLLESVQEGKNEPQHSPLQFMIIAGVLFVTGTLVGALTMQNLQDGSQALTVVKQDISDMRGFMKQHIDNQDALIKELAQALNSQLTTEQALIVEEPPEREALMPEAEE